jgi:methylenetetrahydrofolate--tRNA-(uracil-5-)-methyltransferase
VPDARVVTPESNHTAAVVGAGLAGSEAALVLARSGHCVDLYESRPNYRSPAHTTDLPAELVCSNSFKSRKLPSAHALLKEELSLLHSPLLDIACATAVPAGSALAVDRLAFSQAVLQRIGNEPLITIKQCECEQPPSGYGVCICAAGPLASERLTGWFAKEFGSDSLHFYDAIAPIIDADSIDMTTAFYASRRDEGCGDYLNCPFTEEEYRLFYEALREADKTVAHHFEQAGYFEACLPVEVIASRGYLSLAYGPLRPVGLTDPRTGRRPFAVCQLRRETVSGDSYNMVGFQTRLTRPEQLRVFRMIPGMQNAEFLRYGSIHRNTYLDSPRLLQKNMSFRQTPELFLAGQLTGSEGYTESITTGHFAALFASAKLLGLEFHAPPGITASGALLRHITEPSDAPFAPSNIHLGMLPPLEIRYKSKAQKKEMYCTRAIDAMKEWIAGTPPGNGAQ